MAALRKYAIIDVCEGVVFVPEELKADYAFDEVAAGKKQTGIVMTVMLVVAMVTMARMTVMANRLFLEAIRISIVYYT